MNATAWKNPRWPFEITVSTSYVNATVSTEDQAFILRLALSRVTDEEARAVLRERAAREVA